MILLFAALLAAEATPVKPLPPALAPSAMCEELKRNARERRDERAKVAAERAQLEQKKKELEALAADIDKQRAALREETEKLQALVDRDAAARKPKRKPPPSRKQASR
ncbi:MAG TPA: hypothetical protein VLW85_01040 [Myxococcales bacterium]|nr:hypothetical protein [Myxococcales bacterium]